MPSLQAHGSPWDRLQLLCCRAHALRAQSEICQGWAGEACAGLAHMCCPDILGKHGESPHPGSHALSQAALTIQLFHLQPHSLACSVQHGTQSIVSKSVSGNPQALPVLHSKAHPQRPSSGPPTPAGHWSPPRGDQKALSLRHRTQAVSRGLSRSGCKSPSQQLGNRPLQAASSAAGRSWEAELWSIEPGAAAVHGHKAPAAEAP